MPNDYNTEHRETEADPTAGPVSRQGISWDRYLKTKLKGFKKNSILEGYLFVQSFHFFV